MTRMPNHAGRLRPWERVTFLAVFAVMAGLVVGAAVLDPAPRMAGSGGRTVAASLPEPKIGQTTTPPPAPPKVTGAELDARLAAALQSLTRSGRVRLAVGVIDVGTGAEAVYHPGSRFRAGHIVSADVLAGVLLQHEEDAVPLTNAEADLAASMIEGASAQATVDLWNMLGGASGLGSANAVLNLTQTSPSLVGVPGLTRTTVTDQLQLLSDLTSLGSPLSSADCSYELGLMQDAAAGEPWGVQAAASVGSRYAVLDGSADYPQLWVINSIGMVRHAGHVLLIAVLSRGSRTRVGGIARARAAAVAAADVMTAAES